VFGAASISEGVEQAKADIEALNYSDGQQRQRCEQGSPDLTALSL
jgi:hypothetical protein